MSPSQMPVFLAIPVALFLLLAPGFVSFNLILSFGKGKSEEKPATALIPAEKLFWSVALSAMLDAWAALVLASFGVFSAWSLLLVALLWTLVAGFWLRQRGFVWWVPAFKNNFWPVKRENLGGWLLAGLLLLTTVIFYLARHETVVGAQDSGVYYNTGVNIARTGSLVITDPLLPTVAEQGAKNYPLVLQGMPGGPGRYVFVDEQRLGGFYVMDNLDGLKTGKVIPQFFHLFPSAIAVGVSLFGFYGGLAVMPFLGILAVFAVYLTARRLFPGKRGEWVALLGGLLLCLNGVQVWFTRQTLWETLGEFLTFTGLYSFTMMVRPEPLSEGEEGKPAKELSILGGFGVGLTFGLLCLAHATQAPVILGVLAPYLIWMRLTRRWKAQHWWLLATFGVLALHTVLHIRFFSLAYWEGVYHLKLRDYLYILHYIIIAGVIGLLALIVADAFPARLRALEGWIARRWPLICWGLAALIGAYFLYNYTLRVLYVGTDGRGVPFERLLSWQSYIGAPTSLGPERNLLRLGWYFSPPGVLLAILGVVAMLARKLTARTAMFLVMALLVSYIFIDENYTQEGYIYSLRRYVNVTVPAFSIFMAYALLQVLPELGAWAGGWLSRFSRKRVAYVQTAGGPTANIAFAITQTQADNPVTGSGSGEAITGKGRQRGAKIGLALGLALAAALCLFMVWTNRTIYTLNEYGAGPNGPDMITQLETLAGNFGPKDIIIFSGDRDADTKPATALTYMFNRPAFVLTGAPKPDELANLFSDWEKQGYTIKALLGPDGGRLAPTGYDLKLQGEVTLYFHQFENLFTQKPYNVQENELPYGIYTLTKQQGAGSVGSGQGAVNAPGGWSIHTGQKDYAALVRGFFNVEREKNATPYRWATQTGVMRVPCLEQGKPYQLQLTLDPGSTRPAKLGLQTVKVYLSNYLWDDPAQLNPLTTLTLKPGTQTYTIDLPGNAPASQISCTTGASSLILQLVSSSTWDPATYNLGNDRRQLAVKVIQVKLLPR